jgi:hypothetical protein
MKKSKKNSPINTQIENIEIRVGDRFLYRLEDQFEFVVYEGVLNEISPSTVYIKINNCWYMKDRVRILEKI